MAIDAFFVAVNVQDNEILRTYYRLMGAEDDSLKRNKLDRNICLDRGAYQFNRDYESIRRSWMEVCRDVLDNPFAKKKPARMGFQAVQILIEKAIQNKAVNSLGDLADICNTSVDRLDEAVEKGIERRKRYDLETSQASIFVRYRRAS